VSTATATGDATRTTMPVDPMAPVPHRLVGRVPEVPGTVTITLEPIGDGAGDGPGGRLAAAGPGQFFMIWVPGVGEIPISVSATGDDGRIGLTVRSVGAVSAAIVACEPGAVVGLRGPYGTEWPVAAAAGRDVVVVAGGLGLAPLRLAIDDLSQQLPQPGPDAPGAVHVVVGARDPSQILYGADLAHWSAGGTHVHTTVDAADRTWHGAVGTATALLERRGEHHDVAFVCGPELMMTSAARACIALGTRPDDVWVSLERNMHCGIGHCGRCQLGPLLLCRDGAVMRWSDVADLLEVRGR
jgi:anaerobic sulfite reductase subunit B